MRIGFDTHFIGLAPATGNYTYTAELVRALITIDTQNEYILYAVKDHPYYDQYKDNPRIKVRYVLPANGVLRNLIWLPRVISQDRLDVLHLQYFLPLFTRVPVVLAVHDLFYLHETNPTLKDRLLGNLMMWSTRRASFVVTLSEYSRQDIMARCSADHPQVTVTYLAAHQRFSPIRDYEAISAIRERFGIKRDYILSVGRTEDPRKNLLTLVDAYACLMARSNTTAQLVIAGRYGPRTELIKQKVRDLGLEKNVLFPGIVPDADLPGLLSGAKMVVFVSSFEGFGLPVLEAMACGTPVITSNVTSLPEVAGDAALMVTPGNVEELTQALLSVLNDSLLSQKMIETGLEQVERFSWEQAARSTLEVYQKALALKDHK
jgi:glycosyltransferase involved in cell wall biosynthesis